MLIKDYKQAEYWYKKMLPTATKNKFFIYERLGNMYATGGNGIPKDPDKAIGYFVKAIEGGSYFAIYNTALAYEDKGNYQKAAQYQQMCIERKCMMDILSIQRLGLYFYEGKGVNQSYEKAAELWTKLKTQTGSMLYLAVACFNGNGINKDRSMAVQLIEEYLKKNTKASKTGNWLNNSLKYHEQTAVYKRFLKYTEDEKKFIDYLKRKRPEFFK